MPWSSRLRLASDDELTSAKTIHSSLAPVIGLTSSADTAERPRCRVGQFWPKYKWKTILCTKLFRCHKSKSIDLLHDKSIRKTATLRFWAPFGRLRATYAVHLRIIGKLLMDFLLVITEHFSLGFTVVVLRATIIEIRRCWRGGSVRPKNFR